jgi:hypothetical protein
MPPAARAPFGRPVFDQTITIHSSHAQRLLDGGMILVVRALYGIDVVLRILGGDEEMDQLEAIVAARIGALAAVFCTSVSAECACAGCGGVGRRRAPKGRPLAVGRRRVGQVGHREISR